VANVRAAAAQAFMLKGALGQLFSDLDRLNESQRSPYEKELHRELYELSKGQKPKSVPAGIDYGSNRLSRLSCSYDRCPNKVL